MVNFLFPGFNRRYVIIAMLAAITLVLIGYGITEYRRSYTIQLAAGIRDRQERLRELAELIYAVADAESAQRGFLLTLDSSFLGTFEDAKTRSQATLNTLITQYAKWEPDELAYLNKAKDNINSKFAEMQGVISEAQRVANDSEALRQVRTHPDLHWMEELRGTFEGIRTRERGRVFADVDFWQTQV